MRPLYKTDHDSESTWGPVAVDASVVNSTDKVAVQSVTQATQALNETQRSAAALSELPDPPAFTTMTDANGRITPQWLAWCLAVKRRSGGSVALSQDDLAVLSELGMEPPVQAGSMAEPELDAAASLRRQVADLQALLLLLLVDAAYPADVLRRSSKQIGFFGAALASKPSAITAAAVLTSAYGSGSTALSDVGTTFSQATLNNNFQSVVTKTTNLETRINDLNTRLQALGLLS